MSLADAGFIHQHVMNAFGAQTADERTKPLPLTFSLVGLYLQIERQLNGKQVQQAHTRLAQKKQDWPRLALPAERGAVRVRDVLAAPPGLKREQAIEDWCRSVWSAFQACHQPIAEWLQTRL